MITIYLPAIERHVSIAAYIHAVKLAKQHKRQVFKHGLSSWWPTTGENIQRQFLDGLMDRINQAIPYHQRGK